MSPTRTTKLIHEGGYVAAVEVELTEDGGGWGPCLSPAGAQKLDEVRLALRRRDVRSAAKLARVYSLTPVAI